jgi:hypothetical protein
MVRTRERGRNHAEIPCKSWVFRRRSGRVRLLCHFSCEGRAACSPARASRELARGPSGGGSAPNGRGGRFHALRSRSHSSAFTSGCSTTSRAGVKTALLPDKARTWRDPMRAQRRKEGAMCRQTRLLKNRKPVSVRRARLGEGQESDVLASNLQNAWHTTCSVRHASLASWTLVPKGRWSQTGSVRRFKYRGSSQPTLISSVGCARGNGRAPYFGLLHGTAERLK